MQPNENKIWEISRKNWLYRFNHFMTLGSGVYCTTRRGFIFSVVCNIIFALVYGYFFFDLSIMPLVVT